MKKYIIFIAILCLGVVACKHDTCDKFVCYFGRVVDSTSGEGVPNALVTVYYVQHELFMNSRYEMIKYVYADKAGYYSLAMDSIPKHGDYEVTARHPKFEFNQDPVDLEMKPGTNVRADLKMTALAYVKIHVKNVNPCDEFDTFNLNSFDFRGPKIDTNVFFQTLGNRVSSFQYGTYKVCEGSKYINVDYKTKGHDTTYIEINY